MAIPVVSPETAEAELNSFLQSHRVLSVERRWVDQGSQSFWAICIDYHAGSPSATNEFKANKSKVDYREVLSPEQFARFAKLRDLRKQVAQTEAVPVYTIFTNEQLAEMMRQNCSSPADLEKISGVGDGRVTKYGAKFLELLSSFDGTIDATSKPLV